MSARPAPNRALQRCIIDLSGSGFGASFPVAGQGTEVYGLLVTDLTTDKLPLLSWSFGGGGETFCHFRGIGQRFRFQVPEDKGVNLVLVNTPLAQGNNAFLFAPSRALVEILVATTPEAAADLLVATAGTDPWALATRWRGNGLVVVAPAAKVPTLLFVNQGKVGPALVNNQAPHLVNARLTGFYITSTVQQDIGFNVVQNLTKAFLAGLAPGIQGQLGLSRHIGKDSTSMIPQLQAYVRNDRAAADFVTPLTLPANDPVFIADDTELVAPAVDGEIAALEIQGSVAASTLKVLPLWDERDVEGFNL